MGELYGGFSSWEARKFRWSIKVAIDTIDRKGTKAVPIAALGEIIVREGTRCATSP